MIPQFLTGLILTAALLQPVTAAEHNQLTAAEKAEGWELLFDGKSLEGWRSFKKQTAPKQGWVVEDGILKKVDKVRGGDIISVKQYEEFDFQWEWRIQPKGNNGVKYFITEQRSGAIGHEYQMIDDAVVKNPKGQTASFYEVFPAKADKPLKAAGEWNHSRIVVKGNNVEHWLNGTKVLDYVLGSEEVKAGVAKSKFKDVAGFGTRIKGHILLTDHGDEAFYRNVKIRDLSGK
jgi:hypothetical protein